MLRQSADVQLATAVAVSTPDGVPLASSIAPAAGGTRCPATVRPAGWGTASLAVKQDRRPEDFLASARLPIRRTSFDRQWDNVRRSTISRRALGSIGKMDDSPTEGMLAVVNGWANRRVRYAEDASLYGKADHWAKASDTLRRGAGDCEDIAIVKMQALAALGVSPDDMFLTIARDNVRNADHALLVVKLRDRYWVLDNTVDRPLDAARSYDYQPIMSFSGTGKWLHGFARHAPYEIEPVTTKIALR